MSRTKSVHVQKDHIMKTTPTAKEIPQTEERKQDD